MGDIDSLRDPKVFNNVIITMSTFQLIHLSTDKKTQIFLKVIVSIKAFRLLCNSSFPAVGHLFTISQTSAVTSIYRHLKLYLDQGSLVWQYSTVLQNKSRPEGAYNIYKD